MSKSLGNVINPDDVVKDYGADSMRMYEMFMGPLSVSKPWATTGITGVYRFLDRVWRLSEERKLIDENAPEALDKLLHKTIKKVTHDTDQLEFNTAISQMMIFINELYKDTKLYKNMWMDFIKLLAPYAPHIAEELWEKAGNKPAVSLETWPVYDEAKTIESEVTIVLQINSKNRSKVELPKGTSKEDLETAAIDNERIKSLIEGKKIVKIIAVPDKLVNIIAK